MKPLNYVNAETLEEALAILKEHGRQARPLAGGTDLLGTLKDNIHPEYPELLVNIKSLPGMDEIVEDENGLRVGANVRLSELARHPTVRSRYTALAEAAASVATPQIRRMATLGGNLCQETRCWYYRQPENLFHCLRKGGNVCRALAGENRYHSILGAVRVSATPCSTGCPAGTDIPEYLDALRAGDWDAAARILLQVNPMPAVTGRVCPHFCQQDCNRAELDEAVSIREVERRLGDYILEHRQRFFTPPPQESGKKVAVVGSGPAGLAAAYFLRRQGHAVTILERLPEPGGMLRYAIPAYRLPLEITRGVADCLQRMGVEIRCGVELGKDITLDELQAANDLVFLAPGAWKSPSIGVEGESFARSGLDFLTAIRQGDTRKPGERVVVIGGGNVAVDVALSARRLGASQVTLVCLESREEMPALEWELQQALEEGVQVMNSWGPRRILAQDGRVSALELLRCTAVFDSSGRFAPQYNPAETTLIAADAVLMAVGQRADLSSIADRVQTERGWLKVDAENGQTSRGGVFAAGDAVKIANVIDALAAARKSAEAMHASLSGARPVPPAHSERLLAFHPQCLALSRAAEAPLRPLAERSIDGEDGASLPLEAVEREARRCMNCGCVAVTPSDTGAALMALGAVIETTRRSIPVEEFFACRVGSSTVLESGELVTAVRLPLPPPGSRSAYRKFRLRQSIDFPLVSAAVRLTISHETVQDARIVLGAAAPTPVRALAAEQYLRGRSVAEALQPGGSARQPLPAGEAARLALQDALPLAENAYKVQVTRAYVRRALLACLQKDGDEPAAG